MDVQPGSLIFDNLVRLCESVLQPMRDELGPTYISSGYRPRALNLAIGGSDTSVHPYGLAADISVSGMTSYQVALWFAQSDVVFDQCINEFGRWVHIGIAHESVPPRRELLTSYKIPQPEQRPKTAYKSGIHRVSDLGK